MMKIGSLYILKKNIVLYPESIDTASDLWKATAPFYKLPKVFDSALVLAIKDVLENSRESVLLPLDYSPGKLLKEETNLTFSQLQAMDVKLISLCLENDMIIFSPNKIIGPNKGFVPLNEESFKVGASATDEDLLKALNGAIKNCE